MRPDFCNALKILVTCAFLTVTNLAVADTKDAGLVSQKASRPATANSTPIRPKPELKPLRIDESIDSSAEMVSTARVLLVPDKETTISSTMAARIIAFNGALGQSFRAGDVLVAFDCEEAQARVEMSKAELAGAIEQHEAKVKMQGLEQASDVEVALAASASNKAKAQLNLNQAQVSQCRIYAPWSGRVAKAIAKNNMTVTAGQPLMELVNNGPLKLKLNVPSKLLARLKAGSKFSVNIDETGQTYPAVVSAINSRVDPVSQTVEIEAKLSKSYRELLAGMSGTANIASFN